MHFLRHCLFLFIPLALLFCRGAEAQPDLRSLVETMQLQMAEMQQTIDRQDHRIAALEIARPTDLRAGPGEMTQEAFDQELSKSLGGAEKWLKNLRFSGDLRLRYEGQHFTSGDPAETDDRNRFRYRLRFGFEKAFSPEMKAGFALASGESVNGQSVDPTNTNTSLDNNFNFKDIFVERAYATYTPAWAKRGPVSGAEITAGKFTNPFEKGSSDIVWDRDVRPEGIYEKADFLLLDGENLDLSSYATAGQFVLDEDPAVGGDANLFAHQLGFITSARISSLEQPVTLHTAASYYSYDDYDTNNNFLIGTTSLARGNLNVTSSGAELDAGDFEIIELYNELTFLPRGFPVKPFFDWAHNVANEAPDSEDVAWSVGTKLGGIAKRGDWELGYSYRRIQSEAVAGAFADSDFGLGFAGKRGSHLKFGYAITDFMTLNSSVSLVNNLNAGSFGNRDEEQRRFQTDLLWKF